ncbi:MAG TPA: hypothetical protein DEP38_22260, partial [Cyanobacteria bacterium UBA9226]|nr:hypothetical protein [Cyanobacteria bacterium UBA9226]
MQVVDKQPLVPVIGASGSGKSSVVFAGLIPKLREEGIWLIESFRPQTQPFYGLALALVRLLKPEWDEFQQAGRAAKLVKDFHEGLTLSQLVAAILQQQRSKRILLVVDQFEELYSLCPDEEERQGFLDQLLRVVEIARKQRRPRFTVVFTLRADFYSYVLSYRPFRDALQKYHPQLLGPMTEEELQRAIEKPVENLVELESGLTERMLEDVAAQPGNLPLLEFALTRLWQKQDKGKLTHGAYLEMGGVKQALANHADTIYDKLTPKEQEKAQRIFVQLVHPGAGTEDTRRLATRAEVGEENWELVQELAGESARLVVTGMNEATEEETVEVVHEALIREWQSLREWMTRDRSFRIWQERLRGAMKQWEATGKDDGALLRGVPLAEAEEWRGKRWGELTSGEREFIELGLDLRETEKKEKEKRRRLTIFSLSAGLVGALSLAGLAGWQWGQAKYQKQQVEKVQVSQSEALSSYSNALFSQGQEFDALIEALRGAKPLHSKPNPSMQVVAALRQAVYGVREKNRLEGHSNSVISVSFSPDGKTLASGSVDNTIKIWDIATGEVKATLTGHSNLVNSVSFRPDRKTLASGSGDNTIE